MSLMHKFAHVYHMNADERLPCKVLVKCVQMIKKNNIVCIWNILPETQPQVSEKTIWCMNTKRVEQISQ